MAACLLAFAACKQEKMFEYPGGFDGNLTEVASLSYDEATSGAKSAGFTWDAASALAAGATSFTLELTDDITTNDVENGTALKVVYAPETSYVMTSEVTPGKFYYARIRANYEGYWFSRWTYLGGNDKPLAVLVGTGVVEASFGAPAGISAVPTETSFKATWDAAPFANSYTFEYKAQSSGEWAVVGDIKSTSYEVEGLVGETTYDIRVKAHKGDKESDYTTGTVTTLPPSKFSPQMATADDFIEFLTTEAALASGTSEYSLEADIDLSGKDIPTVYKFKGILDGKNHSIKGLNASAPLFKILTGTVQNLVIEGAVSKTVAADEAEDGHPLATLAIISTGKVINCVNKASVTLNGTGVLGSPVVAGLVAYQQGGEFSGNKNFGEIKLQHAGTAHVEVIVDEDNKFNRKPFSVAGGVVGVVVSATVYECENEGKISVLCTDPSKVTARHYIGGVIGTPQDARVIKCTNKGAITADFTDSAKSAAKQVWVGGIIGGRNSDEKTVDGAYVEDCQNYGELTLIAENNVNNYLAGIGGQATVEATGNNYTSDASTIQKLVNCHNHGKLVKKGAGGCRIGGISGGAATLEDCSNDGEIVVENITAAGAVGGLVGYPTQAYHPVSGCKNTGKMTATCDVAFAFGGLFGQGGNTNQNYANCSVNCEMNAPAKVLCGIILGTAKTIASGKAIEYGTAAEPFKVAGSIRGVELDASNFKTLLVGDGGVTAGGTINVDNVVFGK